LSQTTRRCLGTALIALIHLTMTLPAWAAGDDAHHGPSTSELIWQALNLALLLGVLFVVARKPIRKFFSDRRDQIRGDIDHASDFLKSAEARYAEWQRKLVDVDAELDQIRATARRRAEDERSRILAEARASADRIRQDATAAVDQELRRAQAVLREEAADLAVELAGNLLRDKINEADRERLLDEFISSVEQSASQGATRS
jgi:F-type H+-transporting ATPase subunit b